jgi:hypothetical protein
MLGDCSGFEGQKRMARWGKAGVEGVKVRGNFSQNPFAQNPSLQGLATL